MRIHGFMLGLGMWVGLSTFALAQNATQPDPTVPPVEVRPPAEAVVPVERPLADPFSEFSPQSYPALRNQDFSGLNSATMSDRSIFDLPQPATILNRQMLDERQPQDMFRAMQQEVGVLMQRTAAGQSSPFIRGLTGQQILVLIDGVRMNNATYRAGPNQYFNLIDPGQVERIEVVRGAGSVMYGSDAIGGVINVVTRSASRNRGTYGQGQFVEYFSTADSASYTRANLEGWYGNTGVFAGASYLNVNDVDVGGNQGRQPFTSFDQYAADLKIDKVLADNLLMTMAVQHFEQDNLPRSDRFNPFVQTPVTTGTQPLQRPTFFDVQQRDLAYIRLQGTEMGGLADAFSVTGIFGRNKEASTEIRSTPGDANFGRRESSEFDAWTGGITFVFAKNIAPGVITYGAEYYNDDIDASRVRTAGAGLGPQNPQFPNDSFYERTGAFVNLDIDLTDDLSMVGGVRYENAHTGGTINALTPATRRNFNKSFDNWASSLGLVYEVSDYVNLCTNFTEAFRAPNLDDLAADNGVQQAGQDSPSLNIESEIAYIYDIGFKVDSPRFRCQSFFFWNDLQDAILRAPAPVPPNAAGTFFRSNFDSYIYGYEFAGEYLLDGGWSTYGNFFYTFGEDTVRNEPFSRIPPTQGIWGLRYRDWNHRGWIDMYTWMVDRQDRYAAQNFTDARFPRGGTAGFATLNMRFGTTLGQNDQHLLSLTLENMTDKGYRVLGSGVEGTGFNAIFGWQYTY